MVQEPKSENGDFWAAAIETTRTLLVPFDTGVTWLVSLAILLIPASVDSLIGFGVILPAAEYRIIGAIGAIAAIWQTWILAARAFRPSGAALGSFASATASGALAFGLSLHHVPLRPAFRIFFWVAVVYLIGQAAWLALISWQMSRENEEPQPETEAAVLPSFVEPAAQPHGDTFCVAMTTAPSERAEVIAHRIVEERLAACAQVPGEMTSYYWWKGEVNRDRERLLFLKTRTDLLPDIQALLAEIHPAEVPELVLLPIVGGLPAYISWIGQELRPRRPATAQPAVTDASPDTERSPEDDALPEGEASPEE